MLRNIPFSNCEVLKGFLKVHDMFRDVRSKIHQVGELIEP